MKYWWTLKQFRYVTSSKTVGKYCSYFGHALHAIPVLSPLLDPTWRVGLSKTSRFSWAPKSARPTFFHQNILCYACFFFFWVFICIFSIGSFPSAFWNDSHASKILSNHMSPVTIPQVPCLSYLPFQTSLPPPLSLWCLQSTESALVKRLVNFTFLNPV